MRERLYMTIRVGTASSTWKETVRKRVTPTSTLGRVIGVIYNTDWNQVLYSVR